MPNLDYTSEVWGFKQYTNIDTVENRAIRSYLRVHNFTPNMSIQGDMGWTDSSVRRKVRMIKYWNRLINVATDRLKKNIFIWNKNQWTKG